MACPIITLLHYYIKKRVEALSSSRKTSISPLGNIFRERELDITSVSSILEHTAADGKIYSTVSVVPDTGSGCNPLRSEIFNENVHITTVKLTAT
jgi:acetolactate synthase small subunit